MWEAIRRFIRGLSGFRFGISLPLAQRDGAGTARCTVSASHGRAVLTGKNCRRYCKELPTLLQSALLCVRRRVPRTTCDEASPVSEVQESSRAILPRRRCVGGGDCGLLFPSDRPCRDCLLLSRSNPAVLADGQLP